MSLLGAKAPKDEADAVEPQSDVAAASDGSPLTAVEG